MIRYLGASAIVIVVATSWVSLMPPAPLTQPVNFNHAAHSDVLDCEGCHEGVTSMARAGIPQSEFCVGCHEEAPSVVSAATWEAITNGDPIAWQRVTRVPDHTYFSHRRHAGSAGLACETCHGDVGARTDAVTVPFVVPVMDECLSCHAQEGASEDCTACHR
jgi:predicted CXXCH cytochrome family protein